MALLADDIRLVFWIAVLSTVVAVGLVALGVEEPAAAAGARPPSVPICRAELTELGASFWTMLALGTVLTLARVSEAFLVLHAADTGLHETWLPLVMVVMSPIYSLSACPAGALSDGMDRGRLLALGLAALIATTPASSPSCARRSQGVALDPVIILTA